MSYYDSFSNANEQRCAMTSMGNSSKADARTSLAAGRLHLRSYMRRQEKVSLGALLSAYRRGREKPLYLKVSGEQSGGPS